MIEEHETIPENDSPVIHIAGQYDPSTGQNCVICGEELVAELDRRKELTGKGPDHWAQGTEILVTGNWMFSLDGPMGDYSEACPDAIRCQDLEKDDEPYAPPE